MHENTHRQHHIPSLLGNRTVSDSSGSFATYDFDSYNR